MRKWFICLLLMFAILTGCGDDELYNQAIEDGLEYIANGEYEKAEQAFEYVGDNPKDDRMAQLYTQTVAFQSALESAESIDLEPAKKEARRVIEITEGSPELVQKAEELLVTIENIESAYKERMEEFAQIQKQYENNQLEDTIQALDIFFEQDFEHAVFGTLLMDAMRLRTTAWHELTEEQAQVERNQKAQKAKEDLFWTYSDKANEIKMEINRGPDYELVSNADVREYVSSNLTKWDNLLNELWGDLRKQLSKDEFEQLKSKQLDWIKMKEEKIAELSHPDFGTIGELEGLGYAADETEMRIYYLLDHYLK